MASPHLKGKVVLITGGNAGIGSATVRALASHEPACVYLCARRISSGQEVADSIQENHPQVDIKVLELDLSDFESIKRCAAEFNDRSERLDLLFLNAGVYGISASLTVDGYEHQFGVNHIGHVLLTQLLMPKLLYTLQQDSDADVRIVITSSIAGHAFQPRSGLALNQMKTNGSSMYNMIRYGHSKLANQLFAKKLAEDYPSITSVSCHPGTVKSEVWSKASGIKVISKLMWPFVSLLGVSTDEGAKVLLWCATTAKGKGGVENGKFYMPNKQEKEDNRHARDQKLIDELWLWTNDELAKHGGPGWAES